MKTKLTLIFSILICAQFGMARATRVTGYTKKNGTYVSSHRRTAPNKTKSDNWSHKGNVNPDTGKEGTKE